MWQCIKFSVDHEDDHTDGLDQMKYRYDEINIYARCTVTSWTLCRLRVLKQITKVDA